MSHKQSVHGTFANVSSVQNFTIEDILAELTKTRDSYSSALAYEEERRVEAIENGKPISAHPSSIPQSFAETHNALLLVQRWMSEGVKTIKLNPQKDMRHQILACAKPEDEGLKYSAWIYKNKLG